MKDINPKQDDSSFANLRSASIPIPARLAEIVELANNAVIAFNPQGKITFWNQAAERMYAWKAIEVLGKSSDELFLPIHTTEKQGEQKNRQAELDSGATIRGESMMRRKDGSLFWIEFTQHAMFDEKGKVSEYIAIHRDITERKQIESEISMMAKMPEENPNPVMRITIDGKVVYANAAGQPLLEFWKRQTGQTIPEEVYKGIREAFESGSKKVVEVEFKGKTYSCTLAPIREAGYVNFYGSDITERKLAEQTLKQARIQAEFVGERVARLQNVTAALSEAITPAQVAETLVEQGVPALNAARGTVMELNNDELTLSILHTSSPESYTLPYQRFPVSLKVPAADAFRSGQPVWIGSRSEYKKRYPQLVEQIEDWGLEGAVAIPLQIKDHKLGVLTLSFKQAREFTLEDQGFVLALAQQGAQAFERALLYRQMLQALTELQMTYDQSPIGMIQLDTDLRYIRVNETLARMNGIPAADHIGKSIHEIVPDLAPKVEAGFRKVIETGEPVFNVEVVAETKADPGVPHIWFESWYPLRDDTGKVLGLNIVVQDITDLKRDEHALAEFARRQEALYKLADRLHHTSYPADTFDAALDAILNALQCDRASIMLLDDSGTMRFVAWRGLSDAYRHALEGYSPWKPDEKDPKPIYFNDVNSAEMSEALKSAIKAEGLTSLAFIPLVFNQKLIGRFTIDFETLHAFRRDEIDLSLTISHQLAFGIHRNLAEEALRNSEQQLQILNESLEQKVREQTAEVRRLASDLTKAEQRERHNIAHILHEDLQQRFYAVKIQLDVLQEGLPAGYAALQKDFEEIRKQLSEAISITRHLSVDLSPPILRDEGLKQAVEWLASQMQEQYGLQIALQIEETLVIPNEDIQLLLFSCIRELLFNVVKHAEVKQVGLSIRQLNGEIQVEVRDQGKGFDVNSLSWQGGQKIDAEASPYQSFGLATIRHRLSLFGGQMEIRSKPGSGTLVSISIPAL